MSTLNERAAELLTRRYVRAGDSKMTALHDAAVKQGAMQQLLVWIGFFELFGFVAIVQMLQGGDRQPGDFGFDPLNCAKDNGRAQMVADLRQRYLDGTLDEVLFPAGKEVPDTLLQALLPHLFGAPEVTG